MLLQCADFLIVAQEHCALGLKVGKSDSFALALVLLSFKISMDNKLFCGSLCIKYQWIKI